MNEAHVCIWIHIHVIFSFTFLCRRRCNLLIKDHWHSFLKITYKSTGWLLSSSSPDGCCTLEKWVKIFHCLLPDCSAWFIKQLFTMTNELKECPNSNEIRVKSSHQQLGEVIKTNDAFSCTQSFQKSYFTLKSMKVFHCIVVRVYSSVLMSLNVFIWFV